MDAIMGVEGGGPHSGSPRKIGVVLASASYSAIDVVTARLMSIDPMKVSTISAAVERGILRDNFGDIITVGDPLESLIVSDYKRPSTYDAPGTCKPHNSRMQSFLSTIIPCIQRGQMHRLHEMRAKLSSESHCCCQQKVFNRL
jgi:hypothetical protein